MLAHANYYFFKNSVSFFVYRPVKKLHSAPLNVSLEHHIIKHVSSVRSNRISSPFPVFYTDHSGRVNSNPLLDQLPSYQSLLYRRKSSSAGTKRRNSSRARIGSSGSGKWGLSTISNRHEEKQKNQTEQKPIRELAKPMTEKRRDQ